MAAAGASFTCLFLLFILLLLSNSCCSCPETSPQRCNGIDIKLPFSTNVQECGGYFSVKCDDYPKIQLPGDDDWYAIQSISYVGNILVLRDEEHYSLPPDSVEEDYLYNFTKPVGLIHPAATLKLLEGTVTHSSCKKHDPCLCDFLGPQGCVPCVYYDLFYSNASESSSQGSDPSCAADDKKAFFEWKLSFNESGGLFLLSAGLSHGSIVLRPDCFKHNAIGDRVCTKSNKRHVKEITVGVAAASGFLLICAALLIYAQPRILHQSSIVFRSEPNNMQRIEAFLEENGYISPLRYKYSELKRMTKSFHEKLGHGGYGTVYKGTLPDGRLVAVKMLNDSKGNGEEFINEVASIGRTSHVNVVRLLGFCTRGQKRALVYEFMSNGSLDKFICSEEQRMSIGWKRLHDIAVGIARGLEYLHRGCNTRIVHFDIKPHNILLDDEFCPKISDFGLAKLSSPKDSIISMMDARGTAGYIAPEVFCRNFGAVSTKSDVYSYGMMVLEMTGTTKNPNAGDDNSSETYFPYWIYKQIEQDGDLQASIAGENSEIAKKLILVGLWCIQTVPANRPSIRRVIEMLEGKMDDIEYPPKPSYLSPPLLFVLSSSS